MKYCKKCVIPDTRPGIVLDEEGVCNACRNYEDREYVNWEKRQEEFFKILNKYRREDWYECIVPVSGGKDSIYQVIKMLEYNMKPLCVNVVPNMRSELGNRNMEHLKELGVDVIEYTIDSKVKNMVSRFGLERIGKINYPEHILTITVPAIIAVQMNIPLIIWGENPENEYGGPASEAEKSICDREWFEKCGGMMGLDAKGAIGYRGITEKDLFLYRYPKDEDLKKVGVTGLFLGYYFPWDSYNNTLLVQAYGFETYNKVVEGSFVNYENLDNVFYGIHDYFKFLKFGFGRATDQACFNIRRGRISRQDAIKLVKELEGKFPWEYIGYKLEDMLSFLDLSLEEFISICDYFTNKELFYVDEKGNLMKDARGNLTKRQYDNK